MKFFEENNDKGNNLTYYSIIRPKNLLEKFPTLDNLNRHYPDIYKNDTCIRCKGTHEN